MHEREMFNKIQELKQVIEEQRAMMEMWQELFHAQRILCLQYQELIENSEE